MTVTENTAVAVVDRSRMNALVGSLEERMRAFEQIAANIASLQLNGWSTVQKAKAACWLADAAGMHPATFMQNHWCLEIQGRLMVEPKWEFIVGVLQARVPGFKFEVLIETDDCAKVRMSDGNGNSQTVEYTLADAKRQGLLGRGGNAWTTGNTREMCFKQAVKRAGRRLSSAALMDLPVGLEETEIIPALPEGREKSTATVIDEAIAKATGAPAAGGDGQPAAPARDGEQAPSQPSEDAGETPRGKLFALLTRQYGKLSKQAALEKSSFLYNAMMKEETGVDPGETFTKPGHIGPVEAERIAKYLQGKMEARQTAAGAPRVSGTEGAPAVARVSEVQGAGITVAWKPDGTMTREDDAAPEAETAPEPETAGPSVSDAYAELMQTVGRARKLFEPRRFVKEAPEGSGKLWLVDQATFQQAGDVTSVRLAVGPDVVAPVEKLVQLNAILAAACDEKERGGR